jgi:hypothetical protein
MDTPLIPEWVADELSNPYLVTATLSATIVVAAFIFS